MTVERRSRVKHHVEQSVYELAVERVGLLFDRYDTLAVMFSGGKDSTVVLNVVLDVAIKRGLGHKVEVIHWDEEAVDDDTVEYVERVRKRVTELGGRFRWLCVPIEHRSACSRREPHWYPWAPEAREKWCRELPEGAITELPGFKRVSHADATPYLFVGRTEAIVKVYGMRTQESLRRYRLVTCRDHDSWIWQDAVCDHIAKSMPVYDWTAEDIWTAMSLFGWDYSRAYDKLTAIGIPLLQQRVAPPFGEEPLQRLWQYAQCWPELWEKMIHRVEGAATAGRYSNSPLYGAGSRLREPPPGMTWEQAIRHELEQWDEIVRGDVVARIKSEIAAHNRRTRNAPIPSYTDEGLSWSFLHMIARRGDTKNRKQVKVTKEREADMTGRGVESLRTK